MMTPKNRVENSLRGESTDKTPFTIYEGKLPRCSVERQLRNDGVCLVNKVNIIKKYCPNVTSERHTYTENGVQVTKHVSKTPAGDLFTVTRLAPHVDMRRPSGSTWCISHPFKGPDDYKKLMFRIKDEHVEPNYEAFYAAENFLGQDVIQRAEAGSNPLHKIMLSWMGIETFSIEWSERRDEVEKLYYAMLENLRKDLEIAAKSPTLHANLGGNETGDVMGRERFAKYVVPVLNEAAEIFHKHGKYLGTHLDGNNKVWADLVGNSNLDYIEAFSPYPDTDMTISEAFEAWRNKLVWINFPSSAFLSGVSETEKTVEQIIEASKPERRLIIGITEDYPERNWQENLLAISRTINRLA